MDNIKIGNFISTCRKQKNMTQQELADCIGITNKAISKWETGEGYPDITCIPVLAEALGITSDELLAGEYSNERMAADTAISSSELLKNEKKKNMKFLIMSCTAVYLIMMAAYFIGHFYFRIWNPSVIFSEFLIATAIAIFINISYRQKGKE